MATAVKPANSLSQEQLRALERQLNQGAVPYSPPPVPNDNGLLRQPPNIPNTAPSTAQAQRLVDDLNRRTAPSSPSVPQQNTPIPSVEAPTGLSFGDKVNNTVNRASNAAAVASAALSVGTSVANAVKNQDANSLANAAVATAALALSSAPNPYARAAGLALGVFGSPIVNFLFPSKNNVVPSIGNKPFQGGQDPTRQYQVIVNGTARYRDTGEPIGIGYNNGVILTLDGAITNISVIETSNSCIASVITTHGNFEFLLSSSGGNNRALDGSGYSFSLRPTDGLPLDSDNSYKTLVNNDGRKAFDPNSVDPNAIAEAIKSLKDNFNSLSDDNKEILEKLKSLADPNKSDRFTKSPNFVPSPSIAPLGSGAPREKEKGYEPRIAVNVAPSPSSGLSSTSKVLDRLNEQITQAKEAEAKQNNKDKVTDPVNPDRFKDPKDCKFSCEALAKCFTDLKVQVFDGCNPENGTAKTKEITIQVLPKDKAKTEASFKELLDIRSRECSLNDRVLVVPEYWQVRVGQKPQAAIVYREFKDGKFTNSCWTLHIPHYTGNKNTKPNLSQYSKGESSAIYVCKDNSQLQVYAATEAEAKRLVNQLEKYIDPKFRGDIVKYGTRKGIKKTTVRPVRLDYYSTGQLSLSPDWSIAL